MTSGLLLVTANDGPVSPVFFQRTSMVRAAPLASHGLVKDPVPLEPVGHSCCGSGALDDPAGGALADGAGAETEGGPAALAEGAAEVGLSSLEHPRKASIATVVCSTFFIEPIIVAAEAVEAIVFDGAPSPQSTERARARAKTGKSSLPRTCRSIRSYPQ